MTALAVDTSVAVPLLVQTHSSHEAVARWWDDALVALAAVEHDADLATRDVRARDTYAAVGARVVIAG